MSLVAGCQREGKVVSWPAPTGKYIVDWSPVRSNRQSFSVTVTSVHLLQHWRLCVYYSKLFYSYIGRCTDSSNTFLKRKTSWTILL